MRKLAIAIVLVAAPAFAQRGPRIPRCEKEPGCFERSYAATHPKVNKIDIENPLLLKGGTHALHLVFFLERADEELQRAGLEQKSFIPAMTKSVDEDL